MTLGKASFAECLPFGTRQRSSLPSVNRWLSTKTDGRQLLDGRWRPFAESPLCRVFDTRQRSLCRVGPGAECPALGKEALCREPNFTEGGARQSCLCRVSDKRHSAKRPTLGKASDSGSDSFSSPSLWQKNFPHGSHEPLRGTFLPHPCSPRA
jgi:hypothetical protein